MATLAQQCITTTPPKDAIVLIKGKDNSQWRAQGGGPCSWPTKDGVMTVKDKNIMTKREFGDVQLHIEFFIPVQTRPEAPYGHGNSGVYLHGDYEIQVVDSYGDKPHPGSSCGAIYWQSAPLVNASLPTGKWQSYDVIFRAPKYDAKGKLKEKAILTVIHNGILVQNHFASDATPGGLTANFKNTGPLWLQNHGYPVSYRNIWIRELGKQTSETSKQRSTTKE
jgi:hypothetical protein